MAQNTQIKISNAAVHVAGQAVLGGPNEVTIEAVKINAIEMTSLGMVGKIELFGGIDKMAGSMKLNHVSSDIVGKLCQTIDFTQVQVRSVHEVVSASGVTYKACVYNLSIRSNTALPGFAHKAQEMAEFDIDFSIMALSMEIDSVEIFKFDPMANIYRINGVDQLAQQNAILGV